MPCGKKENVIRFRHINVRSDLEKIDIRRRSIRGFFENLCGIIRSRELPLFVLKKIAFEK